MMWAWGRKGAACLVPFDLPDMWTLLGEGWLGEERSRAACLVAVSPEAQDRVNAVGLERRGHGVLGTAQP